MQELRPVTSNSGWWVTTWVAGRLAGRYECGCYGNFADGAAPYTGSADP